MDRSIPMWRVSFGSTGDRSPFTGIKRRPSRKPWLGRGPGLAAFSFASLTALHAALDRVHKLGVSLPDAPLARFRAQTSHLPETTEVERLIVQRIGQNIFRAALMDYWGGCCPITGITDPALLRASHIVPWAECDDAQRLDVHNGLLLSALWDAAFDPGLVSFADDGTVLTSPELSAAARTALGIESTPRLSNLRDAHRANLAAQRARHGFLGISGEPSPKPPGEALGV
jgi:hypothetical protein